MRIFFPLIFEVEKILLNIKKFYRKKKFFHQRGLIKKELIKKSN
jgi:hypothetical protein